MNRDIYYYDMATRLPCVDRESDRKGICCCFEENFQWKIIGNMLANSFYGTINEDTIKYGKAIDLQIKRLSKDTPCTAITILYDNVNEETTILRLVTDSDNNGTQITLPRIHESRQDIIELTLLILSHKEYETYKPFR